MTGFDAKSQKSVLFDFIGKIKDTHLIEILLIMKCDYSTCMILGSRNPFLELFFGYEQNYAKWGSKIPFFGVKMGKIWNISKSN